MAQLLVLDRMAALFFAVSNLGLEVEKWRATHPNQVFVSDPHQT